VSGGVSLQVRLNAGKSKRETVELQPARANATEAAANTPQALRP
jgi:hypothetical protein